MIRILCIIAAMTWQQQKSSLDAEEHKQNDKSSNCQIRGVPFRFCCHLTLQEQYISSNYTGDFLISF